MSLWKNAYGFCLKEDCEYKLDNNYCKYTFGCVEDESDNSATVEIPKATMRTVQVVELSEDSINAIADAVVRRLTFKE